MAESRKEEREKFRKTVLDSLAELGARTKAAEEKADKILKMLAEEEEAEPDAEDEEDDY